MAGSASGLRAVYPRSRPRRRPAACASATPRPARRARRPGPRRCPTDAICGGPPVPITSTSWKFHDSDPERLGRRLLGAEARRQVLPGARLTGGVRPLGLGEQPLGEPRRPLERPLEPVDLEQVDPDAMGPAPPPRRAHSTVTVLARFRGWSTFSPRRRAMWYASSCSGITASSGASIQSRARDLDHLVGVLGDLLVALGRDRDHPRAARPDLLDVRDHLLEHRRLGRDHDHRRALVEQRDRPVLHLAGGVRVGGDVGDLLELQRALERDRQADVASQVEEELGIAHPLGDRVARRPCRARTSRRSGGAAA